MRDAAISAQFLTVEAGKEVNLYSDIADGTASHIRISMVSELFRIMKGAFASQIPSRKKTSRRCVK
jgi:hypothetical protein